MYHDLHLRQVLVKPSDAGDPEPGDVLACLICGGHERIPAFCRADPELEPSPIGERDPHVNLAVVAIPADVQDGCSRVVDKLAYLAGVVPQPFTSSAMTGGAGLAGRSFHLRFHVKAFPPVLAVMDPTLGQPRTEAIAC